MSSALRIAGLDRQSFRSNPAVFDVVVRGDKSEIRRLVQDGGEVARLYRLGVELGYGQVVHLGRQIRESIERERLMVRQSPEGGRPLNRMPPMALAEAPVTEVPAEEEGTPLDIAVPFGTAVSATPSGAGRKAMVVAFLLKVLARGPVAAKEIERRALDAGLLEDGKPIGGSKVFRTARLTLGVRSYQQPGQKSGGWLWSLPC